MKIKTKNITPFVIGLALATALLFTSVACSKHLHLQPLRQKLSRHQQHPLLRPRVERFHLGRTHLRHRLQLIISVSIRMPNALTPSLA